MFAKNELKWEKYGIGVMLRNNNGRPNIENCPLK